MGKDIFYTPKSSKDYNMMVNLRPLSSLVVGCLTGYKVEVVASLANKDLTPDMTR